MISAWKQEKPEARKMPENAQTPTSRVHAVLGGFLKKTLKSFSSINTDCRIPRQSCCLTIVNVLMSNSWRWGGLQFSF